MAAIPEGLPAAKPTFCKASGWLFSTRRATRKARSISSSLVAIVSTADLSRGGSASRKNADAASYLFFPRFWSHLNDYAVLWHARANPVISTLLDF